MRCRGQFSHDYRTCQLQPTHSKSPQQFQRFLISSLRCHYFLPVFYKRERLLWIINQKFYTYSFLPIFSTFLLNIMNIIKYMKNRMQRYITCDFFLQNYIKKFIQYYIYKLQNQFHSKIHYNIFYNLYHNSCIFL